MKTRVLDRQSALQLGIGLRQLTIGPEQDLVKWFIDSMPIDIPLGCRSTTFLEPRIESGFPDIVVVIWDPRVTSGWKDQRRHLKEVDIRVLHHLAISGRQSVPEIKTSLRLDPTKSLIRLNDAGTIRMKSGKPEACPLSKIYAVRSIMAFEAKIRGWGNVLTQATLNTWFASHSYILIPDEPRIQNYIDIASRRGVGVWTRDQGCLSTPSLFPTDVPLSYASWLFNEWTWRFERFRPEAI